MKKKHLTRLLLVAFMALTGAVGAQPVLVTVGDGTSSGYIAPFNNFYKNSYNQMVYDSQTLISSGMTAGYIGAIAYDCDAVGSLTLDEISIYMGVSQNATIASTAISSLVPYANLTRVFHATNFAMPTTTGWFQILLDTPYQYDPAVNGNLVIVVSKKASNYASGLKFSYTSDTNAVAYRRSDSDTSYASFPTAATTLSDNLPNIQFTVNTTSDFCFPPSSFSIADIDASSVNVTWNANESSGYQVAIDYASATFDPATATWISLPATATSYTFNGLNPNTSYTVYIRSICGDGFSAPSSITSTTTAIPAIVPYATSFDDDDILSWSFANGDLPNYWVIDTATHCGENSTHALYITNGSDSHPNEYTITSACAVFAYRPITFGQDGLYDIAFDWKAYGEASADFLRVALVPASVELSAATTAFSGLTATATPAGWIPLDGGNKLNLVSAWQHQRIATSVPAGTYNLAFYWRNDGSLGTFPPAAVDNISIAASVCPGIDSVDWVTTETTATITAFYSGTPSELMLIYQARGAQQPDTVYSSNGTFILTDIAASSYYDATIYTICGPDTTFANYDFNFKTDCSVITNLPWDYGFENATWFHYTSGCTTMYWPYCWNAANKGGSTTYNWRQTTTVANVRSGETAAYFYSTTTATSQAALDEWLKTPTVDLTGNDRLSFWIRSSSTTTTAIYHARVSVRVSPADDLDADSLYENVPLSGGITCNNGYYTDLTGTTYTQYFADLSGFTGNRRIAFVVDTNSYTFYMDDIRLFTASNCPDALNPRVENYNSTSAVLAWGDTASNPTTTSWDLYFGQAGFSIDTVSPITLYDTTYLMEDLMPQTDYEFYVIAHCSDGSDANATTPVTFTTACAPVPTDSLPYVEDFEAYGSGTSYPISPCWTRVSTGGSPYPYPSSTAAINGNRGLYCYGYLSSTLGTSPIFEYAALPLFEADINTLRLRFNTKRYSTVSYKSRLYVGVMSNLNDLSTFDTVAFIDHTDDPAGTITAEEIFFDQYTGDGSYITILIPAPGAGQYNYIYIDDVVVDLIPDCRRSTNLVADNVTTSDADLSWYNGSVVPVSDYTVAYSTEAGFNPDTCSTTLTTTSTTVSLSGLEAYTRYYWAVRANCSDNAEWSHLASFMTSYDCGTGNVANILDTIGNGTSSSYTYTTYAYTTYPKGKTYMIFTAEELAEMGLQVNNTINSISLQSGTTGGTINHLAIYMAETDLEEFSTTAANDTMHIADMQLVYYGNKTFTASTWNEIFLDTAFAYSGTRNLMILLYRDTVPSASTTFYYGTVPGTKYRTCYGYQSSTGTSITATRAYYRDNIAFNICTTIPSCDRPNNVTLSGLQPTAVQFDWTGDAATYEVAYGPQGFNPDSTEGARQVLSATTIALTGLNAQTDYDFYVRSLCSHPTDTSAWTFPYHFTTPCLPQGLPYTEDFESYASGSANPINPCWTKGTNSTTQYPYPYSTNAVSGQRSLYFYGYQPSSATSTPIYSYAALPLMNAPVDSLTVSFKMRRHTTTTDYYTSRIVVGLMSDPNDITTFTPVDTIDMKNEPSLAVRGYEVSFAGHANEGQFITFYDEVPPLYGSGTYTYSYVWLDDVEVDYIPTCPRVLDVTVADTTITSTSAVVSWTDRATPANGYELEYGPEGFLLGAGTRIQSTTNPTTITGLMGGSTYEVYVRPICSVSDTGSWSFATSFATSCVTIANLPYVMDFENEATGTSSPLPLCWTRFNNATGTYNYYPYINSSSTYAHSGTKYLYFYGSSSTTYADNQIATLPEVDTTLFPMNSLELHFWGHGYNSTSTTYISQVLVGVMSDPNNVATFQLVDTVNMNATMAEYVVDFSNFQGHGSYVSLMVVKPATSSTSNYAYVDDITLQLVPDCPPVSDIVLAAIDSNMIALSWTDTVNTTWSLEYGPEGFTPGTGTTVAVNTLPVTVNGLATATRYTFIVTPFCDGLVYPTTATFRTAGTYYQLPFAADFENVAQDAVWTFDNGTNINAWYTGTATHNGGSRSLYVSNDQGLTNAYTVGAASLSYAYVTLNLDAAGDYEYTFDWKAQGESTFDYLHVALIPVSEDIEAINGATVPTGMAATTVPESWISLHPGVKLNLDSTWTSITDVVSLAYPGIYRLAFVWRNDASGGVMPPAAIDNVIFQRSTCSRPANLRVSNVTAQSATVTWTEMGSATQWQYTLDGVNFIDVNATTLLLSGLTDATAYTLGVRSVCGAGDTSFVISQNFTTPCFPLSASDTIFEDFEGYATAAYNAAGDIPTCWDAFSNGTSAIYMPHVVNSGSSYCYPHSGVGALTMTSGSEVYGTTKFAVLPLLAEPVSAVKIDFWYRMENSSYGTLTVGYVTDADYLNSFVPVKTFTSTTTYTEDSVSFDSVPAEATRIAFRWTHTASFYSCAIDDITITATAFCGAPSITSVTNDYESADVSWAGSGSTYQVQLRTFDGVYGEPVTVTDNSYHFSGLQPATTYLFQVRQDCTADSIGFSAWTEGVFTTDSLPCFAPEALEQTAATYRSVTLSWTPGGAEAQWQVRIYSTTFDSIYDATTSSATISGLQPGITYSAAVRALCGNSLIPGDWSDAINVTTADCQPVTNVRVTNVTAQAATITWTAGGSENAWVIEYSDMPDFATGTGTIVNATSNPFDLPLVGFEPETEYYFYVYAQCDASLRSVASDRASFTTQNVGIDDVDATRSVSIYPNPATHAATLTLSGVDGQLHIDIVDMNGRKVQSLVATADGGLTTTLDLSTLAQGAYFVRIYGDNFSSVKKLVVR